MQKDEVPRGDATLQCPKCGAKVAMPTKVLFFKSQLQYLHCDGCGADLQPRFCAEKGLLFYGAYAVSVGLAMAGYFLVRSLGLIIFAIFVVWLIIRYVFSSLKLQINKRCVQGFEVVDKKAPARQFWRFTLLDSIHAVLIIAVLIGTTTTRVENDQWLIMLGGFILWGLIEFARYISIKRSQGRIS